MSIRKPHNHVTTISANGTGGYSNAPAWVGSTIDEDAYKVSLNSAVRISRAWGDIGEKAEVRKPKFIPTPDWIEKIEGHVAECFEMGGYSVGVIAVCYKPDHTLGVGFAKVYIVDKKTGQPFPQMKGVWAETKNRDASAKLDAMFRNLYSKCGIDEDGRLSGAFGVPDLPAMCSVIQDMLVVWNEWREFPNVSDFSMVKRLQQAKKDVAAMQSQMENKYIEQEIESYRKEIKESQEKIAKLEKELNEICEKAADGMNLLEEHGVKIDLDKMDSSSTGNEDVDWNDLYVSYDPSSVITVKPPNSGTLMSTYRVPLTDEERKIFEDNGFKCDGISAAHAAAAINSVCASLSCAS